MTEVNIHEAKTHLSKLLQRVAMGEEVIISKSGTPIAKLVPFAPVQKRRMGLDAGLFKVPDNFDAPFSDEDLARFEG